MAMSSAASRVSSSLQTKSKARSQFTILDLTRESALQTGNGILEIIFFCLPFVVLLCG